MCCCNGEHTEKVIKGRWYSYDDLFNTKGKEASMSYRCEVCRSKVSHGNPCKRHIVYYPPGHKLVGNVQKEVKVCDDCFNELESGAELEAISAPHVLSHSDGGPERLKDFDFGGKRRLY